VGQKQLICLVRVLLKKARVLVLDEATASLDPETDLLIQKTIRSKLTDCTLITIAHRLETVLDYDKVLVLEKGQMVEFNSPQILLKNQGSKFYQMVQMNDFNGK
jgi:ATP-binding cassette subfamily C (CFTR/MRP) protein 1